MLLTRVLLVDDSAIMRSMVRRLFESQPGFEVSGEAENGQEAIEKAANLKPDLIILDLAMPVMTGLDAAPVLRKMLPATLLILFTVHEGREVAKLALAAGINAVVPKTQAALALITQAQVLLAKCKVV
jgi:two-component system nitrate/nitrite response regulator NarL